MTDDPYMAAAEAYRATPRLERGVWGEPMSDYEPHPDALRAAVDVARQPLLDRITELREIGDLLVADAARAFVKEHHQLHRDVDWNECDDATCQQDARLIDAWRRGRWPTLDERLA